MYHINITFMYKHSIQHICQIKICLFNNWSPKPIGPPLVDLEVERAFRRDDAAAAVREAYLQPHKPVVDLLAREQNLAFENISGEHTNRWAHEEDLLPPVRISWWRRGHGHLFWRGVLLRAAEEHIEPTTKCVELGHLVNCRAEGCGDARDVLNRARVAVELQCAERLSYDLLRAELGSGGRGQGGRGHGGGVKG